MWTDIQTLEGYLGLQEALRNGHEAFKGRALGGPVAYDQIPALAERGRRRGEVFFDKLETRLSESPFIAGERFTYADIVGYVYLGFAARAIGGTPPVEGRPALQRWSDTVAARPAIQRAS
jgi:glutathione S-transferase